MVSGFNIDILALISCIRSVETGWCKFKHYLSATIIVRREQKIRQFICWFSLRFRNREYPAG